jgi:beta-glucosidase
MSGLDQQSGFPFDDQPYFGALMLNAVASGELKEAKLDEMARRIVRTLFAKGVIDYPVKLAPIDLKGHAHVTRAGAEQGSVLLKNDGGLLPLSKRTAKIAVIGGYADRGVLAGGGSSLVYAVGGNAVPDLEPKTWPGPIMYYPSSPLRAIQALAPGAKVTYDGGTNREAAAKLAAGADVALVFVTQWTGESVDKPLTLPDEQDALVSAIAAANPRTVVVIEAGGAVFMPWIGKVPAVLHAWYPGTAGGEAIANLLFGVVNPSGHLPISLPKDESQFARAELEEKDAQGKKTLEVNYAEGATVGYKWMDARGVQPLFAFGHGLSYSKYAYSNLQARLDGQDLVVKFQVKNSGRRDGKDVPQVYVSPVAGGWEAPKRLAGWKKVELQSGASETVELRVDPRLLGMFTEADKTWRIAPGTYRVMLGKSSADLVMETSIELPERKLPVRPKS